MNNYEGLFIIKSDLKEEDIKNVCKSIGETIGKNSGSVNKEETWGKRQLAYPVKKAREGYYYKVDFTAPSQSIFKIESAYRLNGDILRTMITKR